MANAQRVGHGALPAPERHGEGCLRLRRKGGAGGARFGAGRGPVRRRTQDHGDGEAQIATAVILVVGALGLGAGALATHGLAGASQPAAQAKPPAAPERERKDGRPAAQAKKASAAVKIRGRVLGPDGKPFVGAKLYLAYGRPKEPTYPVRATSGDNGRFGFTFTQSELDKTNSDNLPAQVMAVAEGHGCDWVKAGPATEDLTLRLVKDVPISGSILDPDGRPVAGAKLTVKDLCAAQGDDLGSYLKEARMGGGYAFAKVWHGPLPGQPAVPTTGADGRFRLAGVGRERVVNFQVEGPAIASAGLQVMTRAAETVARAKGGRLYGASPDYVAIASRPIRGVVRDKDTGKPLAGVSVEAGLDCKAFTDNEGRYVLLGVAKSRRYSLEVKPANGLHFQRRAESQDTPGLGALTGDIELVRELTVRGRVTDKATGKPVAQARVNYHPLGGNTHVNAKLAGYWSPRAEATTGSDGSYAPTVLPGPGVIGVIGPKPDAYMPAMVTLKERKDFFKGPLVDDDGEDYLTRAAGDNSFGAISQRDYNALVLLEPGEKEEALVKDVTLEPPRERKGRVVGPDDRPVTGVTVVGLPPYGLIPLGVETLKGAEVTVWGINPKANRPLVFYLKEKNLGFLVKELRGEPSGPLTVKLQPCGSVSGRVVDQDGQPVAGFRLSVSGMALHWAGDYVWVTTDKGGRFRAAGLVPGQEYWVWDPGGLPRVFARVRVEPGKLKDLGDVKMTQRGE
jgi:protocatechuate 3,4-dioxygenase beta subunit